MTYKIQRSDSAITTHGGAAGHVNPKANAYPAVPALQKKVPKEDDRQIKLRMRRDKFLMA